MTFFDGLVVLIILVSAFLAMIRGFSREIFSILSWILAITVVFFLLEPVFPFFKHYISDNKVAFVATIVVIFLVAILIFSSLAMKLADIIIDSCIGRRLDHSLGFIFGIVRGILIVSVLIFFTNSFAKPLQQYRWITESKTKPVFDMLGTQIWDLIPQKVLYQLYKKIKIFEKNNRIG